MDSYLIQKWGRADLINLLGLLHIYEVAQQTCLTKNRSGTRNECQKFNLAVNCPLKEDKIFVSGSCFPLGSLGNKNEGTKKYQ